MLLLLSGVLLIAGAACFRIDREAANYFRARLRQPLWRFGFKVTDFAKGGIWIGGAAVFYLAVQALMELQGETDSLRWVGDFSLALLASFVVGSAVLHGIKIFVGRRRPRDDAEHGLYGFKYFTWELQFDSFPSGHAMTMFCVAVVLCAAFPMFSVVWLTVAAVFGLLRAFLTAHFFSDVMVGSAIGVLSARETLAIAFPHLYPSWF